MPNQIHFSKNTTFLASGDIHSLALSPEGKKLIAFCGEYGNYQFSVFDSISGIHIQDLKLNYNDFNFSFYKGLSKIYFLDRHREDASRFYSINELQLEPELEIIDWGIKFKSEGYYRDLVFNEKRILIGNSNILLIYDRASKEILKEIKGPWSGNENGIAISPNAEKVVFANWETNQIQTINIADGSLGKIFTAGRVHDQNGTHLQFLPDSKILFVAAEMIAELWDTESGLKRKDLKVRGIYQSTVIDFCISDDGEFLLIFYTGLHLALFRLSDGEQLWIKTNMDGLHGFCFSADTKTVFYSIGMKVQKADTLTGETEDSESKGLGSLPNQIFKLPEENALLVLLGKQAVKIDVNSGALINVLYADRWPNFAYHQNDPNAAFNLLCAGDYETLLLNAGNGRHKTVFNAFHGVHALSSEFIAATDGYLGRKNVKELYVYDHSGKLLHSLAKHQKNTPVYGMKFLADGIRFVGLAEKFLALWDASKAKQLWQIPFKNAGYTNIVTDPDGKFVFVKNTKEILFCIDAENGNMVWEYSFQAKKDSNKIQGIFVSGNNLLLIGSSGDARLLNISDAKENHKTILDNSGIAAADLEGNILYAVHSNTALAHYDFSDWLDAAPTKTKSSAKKSQEKTELKTTEIATGTDFKGKNLLFTGTLTVPRKEAEEKAVATGANILSGVNKKLDYLIVGEDAGSKLDKAKSLGVKILNEQEFWFMLAPKNESSIFEIPSSKMDAKALLEYFKNADWSGFDWERDAVLLRDLLLDAEKEESAGELHKFCSAKLMELDKSNSKFPFFKLKHRFGHLNDIVGYGLSADGKYLATGSWVGEDYYAGGELMIWEVATGRTVNIMSAVNGGIGWPDYSGNLQWSPDGKLLGLGINTNGQAIIKPFAESFVADEEVYLTDGWSRPAQWCWHPEGKAIYVSCWDDDYFLPGQIVPIDRKAFAMSRPYGFIKLPKNLISEQDMKDMELMENDKTGEKSPLSVFHSPGWSSKGFLFGCDNDFAFTQHPIERSISGAFKISGYDPFWSADGGFLILTKERKMEVYSSDFKLLQKLDLGAEMVKYALDKKGYRKGEDMLMVDSSKGKATLLFGNLPVQDISKIIWHPNESLNLFVVTIEGDNGFLALYKDFKFIGIIKSSVREIGRWEMADIKNLVFSPDGTKLAVLGTDDELTVWSVEKLSKISSFEVIENTKGILWGINDIIITVNEQNLAFYHADGSLFSHYFVGLGNEDPLPDLSYSPLGRFVERFEINPYFPISKGNDLYWIAAFSNGLVIADEKLKDQLDEELTYVIGNKIAWPFRWTETVCLKSLELALNHAEFPFPDSVKKQIVKTLEQKEKKAVVLSDYFMSVNKKEVFGKNVKKNGYGFSDNSGSFWKDTRNAVQIEPFDLALKKAKDYKLAQKLTGDDINYENIRKLLGKVVLFAESYSPSRVQIGTVISVEKDSCYVFYIEFNDNNTQGGSGSSSLSYANLPYIGLAEPR
jgi:WD40 repeat protein